MFDACSVLERHRDPFLRHFHTWVPGLDLTVLDSKVQFIRCVNATFPYLGIVHEEGPVDERRGGLVVLYHDKPQMYLLPDHLLPCAHISLPS